MLPRRFWDKVDKTDSCWNWTGATRDGYGSFMVRQQDGRYKPRYPHRLVMGEPDAVVRHKCDNPLCCNPEHLEVGTRADNSQDMVRRGRAPDGRNHKLLPRHVVEIRLRTHLGESQRSLAEEYGVHRRMVGKIVNKQSWQRTIVL